MELKLSLAPSGDLRLHVHNRFIDIRDDVAGIGIIKRILRDADAGIRDQRGYIAEFPTQAVIDAWQKADSIEKRLAAEARREAEKDEWKEKRGIDLDKVEFGT